MYTQVVRATISYGASIFHKPTPLGGNPQGPARALAAEQTRALLVVGGAYKATPARLLESELGVLLINIYLNERVARFQSRLERQGIGALVRAAAAAATRWIRRKRQRAP